MLFVSNIYETKLYNMLGNNYIHNMCNTDYK